VLSVIRQDRRQEVAPAVVLVVASFGAFLAFLDSTIVNVAFPSIQSSFAGTPLSSLSWVLNAYNIVFAAFLVAAGRVADLIGRRRMFVLGVLLFTVASAGCAAAGSVDALITYRAFQALGAALLVPASLAAVVEAFPPERRAHGIGLWGAAAALAAGLGPPIGGALVDADSWRLAFLVNVPLGLVAVVVARRTLVESRAVGSRSMPDVRGAGLLALALATVTLGVVKGGDWGWTSWAEAGCAVLASLAVAGFVRSSRRHPSPVLDPALLRITPFAIANLATLAASMGFYAYLLTHILWLHYVWGYSLLAAGLAVAPGALVAAVTAAVVGHIADAKGYRRIALPGALVWAGGFAWYLFGVSTHPHLVSQWLPGQLLSGVGVGATLPVLASAALAAVPGGRYATASAVVSSTRQIGAALGVAVLVVIIGVPSAASAAHVFREGWAFSAVCFLACAAIVALLPRGASAAEVIAEPQAPARPDVNPFPLPVRAASPASAIGGLSELPLFEDLDAQQHRRLAAAVEHTVLLAGDVLFAQGEPADAIYTVTSGRLEVVRDGVRVAELGVGAAVGELGVLTGAPRAATVRACRDSTLVRLAAHEFAALAASEPAILGTVAKTVAGWLQQGREREHQPDHPSVVAVVGLDELAPVRAVAETLVAQLKQHLRVTELGQVDAATLARAEADYDRVVLAAEWGDTPWWQACLRQADRVVLVAGVTGVARELPAPAAGTCRDLVLVGEQPDRTVLAAWQAALEPARIYRVRSCRDELRNVLRPLSARLAGRSVGLVLGGGGARALAHLGVIDVLDAAGVQVDRVSGASFGALIGALYASGHTADEVDATIYNGLVRRNPFNDYTLPRTALTRGNKVLRNLRHTFGEVLIEELPREFCATSVDLLSREPVVHRTGPVAPVVAASMRLPGLFPPMLLDGRLHIDGGLMDNLPVRALQERPEGPVIAVSINLGSASAARSQVRVPSLADTLMRSMMLVGATATDTAAREHANVTIRPDAAGVGLLEFHQLDRMRESGRRAAEAALESIEALFTGGGRPSPRPARPRPRPRQVAVGR
jgi:EmrB/QacA subfamily drug resistance transporter